LIKEPNMATKTVALELERLRLARIALTEIHVLTRVIRERIGDEDDPYATNIALMGMLGRIGDLSVAVDECIESERGERTDNKEMLRVLLSERPSEDDLADIGPDQHTVKAAASH
jgi:hypothetical protein